MSDCRFLWLKSVVHAHRAHTYWFKRADKTQWAHGNDIVRVHYPCGMRPGSRAPVGKVTLSSRTTNIGGIKYPAELCGCVRRLVSGI